VEEAVRIATEIAQGLAALHELDAVHRDVKPSNILFDDKGRAMLADLGLAQAPGGPSMRSVMSQAMSHPGTPAYMSPEQASGFGHLSPSSDVYALGAVLFEMLTGRLYANVRPGTPVTKYRKDAPDWLVEALGRMLAETPKERPWDGEEAAGLLQRPEVRGQKSEVGDQRLVLSASEGSEIGRGAPLRSPKQAEEERSRREREAAEKARKEREAQERAEQDAARKRAKEEQNRRELEVARKQAEWALRQSKRMPVEKIDRSKPFSANFDFSSDTSTKDWELAGLAEDNERAFKHLLFAAISIVLILTLIYLTFG
jgi:serine/threonine protein kinase